MSADASVDVPVFVDELHDRIGYRPQDGCVVTVALDAAGRPLWAATLADMGEGMTDAQVTGAAERVAAADYRGAANGYVVLGYGAGGDARATRLSIALAAAAPHTEPVIAHVHGDQVRSSSARDPWAWSAPQSVPGLGRPSAAEAAAAAYAPREDVPAAYPPGADLLEQVRPSRRAEAGIAALHALTTPEHHGDPQLMERLTRAVAGDRAVRDAILTDAAADPTRVQVLVQAYRDAPLSHRPAMATTAAAALAMTGAPTPVVAGVLKHAATTGTHARLAALVRAAARCGVDVSQMHSRIDAGGVTKELASADRIWRLGQAAEVRTAVFGAGAPTPARAADNSGRATAPVVPIRTASPSVEL